MDPSPALDPRTGTGGGPGVLGPALSPVHTPPHAGLSALPPLSVPHTGPQVPLSPQPLPVPHTGPTVLLAPCHAPHRSHSAHPLLHLTWVPLCPRSLAVPHMGPTVSLAHHCTPHRLYPVLRPSQCCTKVPLSPWPVALPDMDTTVFSSPCCAPHGSPWPPSPLLCPR